MESGPVRDGFHAGWREAGVGRAVDWIAFCGMTGEGAIADWSAIYMNKTVGMNEGFSALAFDSFAIAMTVRSGGQA